MQMCCYHITTCCMMPRRWQSEQVLLIRHRCIACLIGSGRAHSSDVCCLLFAPILHFLRRSVSVHSAWLSVYLSVCLSACTSTCVYFSNCSRVCPLLHRQCAQSFPFRRIVVLLVNHRRWCARVCAHLWRKLAPINLQYIFAYNLACMCISVRSLARTLSCGHNSPLPFDCWISKHNCCRQKLPLNADVITVQQLHEQ